MRDDPNHPRSEDIFAYRDGELPPEKRALVEAHVMGCSACRVLIDQVASLEAELRRSPDRSPADYLEHLHESVRARIAVPGVEDAAGMGKAAQRGRVRADRDAGSRRDRRGVSAEDRAREEGRIKEAPGLPWAAVLSTASAAAAVLVVVVILVKQGVYQRAVVPTPARVSQAPAGGAPSESAAAVGGIAAEAPPAGAKVGATTADKLAEDLAKLDAAKKTRAKDQFANTVPPGERIMAQREAPPAASSAPESADRDQAASSRFRADEQRAGGSEYEALLKRLGLPPVWNASVPPGPLERAEPELRNLYVSGRAGADSARVRLYLAEAMRLRYTPGDSMLYEGIVHHYRRAIALARSDPEAARVAEGRLRTLER